VITTNIFAFAANGGIGGIRENSALDRAPNAGNIDRGERDVLLSGSAGVSYSASSRLYSSSASAASSVRRLCVGGGAKIGVSGGSVSVLTVSVSSPTVKTIFGFKTVLEPVCLNVHPVLVNARTHMASCGSSARCSARWDRSSASWDRLSACSARLSDRLAIASDHTAMGVASAPNVPKIIGRISTPQLYGWGLALACSGGGLR